MGHWNEIRQLSPDDFGLRFSSNDQCLTFLEQEKWPGSFTCRKCGHTHYCHGKTTGSRRCTRCKSEESATAHTIFHGCKIELTEAFRLLYSICNQPGISSYKLSEQHELRQMTCWKFKKKIEQCMKLHREMDLVTDRLKEGKPRDRR